MEKYYDINKNNMLIKKEFDDKFDLDKISINLKYNIDTFNEMIDWYDIYNKININFNTFYNILKLLDIELYNILYYRSNLIKIDNKFIIDFFNNNYHQNRIINKTQLKYYDDINTTSTFGENNKLVLILNTVNNDINIIIKILNKIKNVSKIFIITKNQNDNLIYLDEQYNINIVLLNNNFDIYQFAIQTSYINNILLLDLEYYNDIYLDYLDILYKKNSNYNYIITEYIDDNKYKKYDKRILYLSLNQKNKYNKNNILEYLNLHHIVYLYDICINNKLIINEINQQILDNIIKKENNIIINKKTLCVLCHIGNINIFKSIIIYLLELEKLSSDKYDINLYFNIVKDLVNKDDITILINKYFNINRYKYIKIFISDNKGFDIGGYINILKNITDYNNDIYITCHTKTDNEWRNSMFKPIFNNLESNLDLLNNDIIGIIGARKRTYKTNFKLNKNNYNHMRDLIQLFNFKNIIDNDGNIKNFYFIGGTCMIISKFIIDIIINFGLDKLYNLFNDKYSVDYNWYLHHQTHPKIYDEFIKKKLDINQINAQKHYENNNDINISPNLLHAIIFNKKDSHFRDSMFEHSFERLFGLISFNLNKLVIAI